MVRAYSEVLKVPLLGESLKVLTCKLWSIVTDYGIRYTMARELALELVDHFLCRTALSQLVQLEVIAKIVHSYKIFTLVEGEQVTPDLAPRPICHLNRL